MLLFLPNGRANKRPPLITPLMPISLKLPGEPYLPFVYELTYRSIMISGVACEMPWPTEYYAISSEKIAFRIGEEVKSRILRLYFSVLLW